MGYYDLALEVTNRQGALAEVGDAFGKAGVNLEGVWAHEHEGTGHLHVLVADRAAAEKVATQMGWNVYRAFEVLVAPVENRPGWLGDQCRLLASAGVNVEFCYMATENRIAVSVKDLAKARQVWETVGSASR